MEFKIEKEIFLKALGQIQGIIEKKHTIPILANVHINAKNNELTLTATDLEIGVRSKFSTQIIEDGKITVSAKKLFEIIRELPDKEINFKSKDNCWIEIKCDKSIFNLVGLSSDEYPKFPEFKSDNLLNISSFKINEMIDKTIFSISNDETKYNLNGIFLKYEDEKLSMISTDGHRLSYSFTDIEEKFILFDKGIILPKKGIFELRKIINKENNNLEISIVDNNFIIIDENTILIMRLVDGDFPDYKRVIPEKCENTSIINKNEFFHALKRISVLSSEKTKGIKINFTNNKAILTSSNPDLGDASEEIDISYKGKDISIGFNSKYILDILQAIDEEFIEFHLKDNLSPGMIEPEKNKNFISVIMPMRL
ncbi:DNA polymerase III subunit beta [Geopsychrobacter electrodiphilus]|uniref:DNA polymerase III subunit beta n=1 Tax=Geopsychrobacter electrodiphilus TaxID=225196 RepID=UPI00035F0B29|nr:DNA polymerase III subunit beta [Geopsychrobacter electrodiphilus]